MNLTVWIPVRNAQPFIAKCIDSLLSQDHLSWSCVLVDDASEDRTFDIAQGMVGADPRFTLLQNGTRKKKMLSFLDVFDLLSGDVIVELDGDDWFERFDALSQIAACYSDPLVDATSGRAIDTNDEIIDNGYAFMPRSIDTPMIAPRSWRLGLMKRGFSEIPEVLIDPKTRLPWESSADMAIFGVASNYARKITSTRDPIYRINLGNPQSDRFVDPGAQNRCSNAIYDMWRERWFSRPYEEEP